MSLSKKTGRFVGNGNAWVNPAEHKIRGWQISCSTCGLPSKIIATHSGTSLSPPTIVRKFEREGWFVDARNEARDLCPKCYSLPRSRRSARPAASSAWEPKPVPKPDPAPAPARILPAGPPRHAAIEAAERLLELAQNARFENSAQRLEFFDTVLAICVTICGYDAELQLKLGAVFEQIISEHWARSDRSQLNAFLFRLYTTVVGSGANALISLARHIAEHLDDSLHWTDAELRARFRANVERISKAMEATFKTAAMVGQSDPKPPSHEPSQSDYTRNLLARLRNSINQ